jgi:hypothetical protein
MSTPLTESTNLDTRSEPPSKIPQFSPVRSRQFVGNRSKYINPPEDITPQKPLEPTRPKALSFKDQREEILRTDSEDETITSASTVNPLRSVVLEIKKLQTTLESVVDTQNKITQMIPTPKLVVEDPNPKKTKEVPKIKTPKDTEGKSKAFKISDNEKYKVYHRGKKPLDKEDTREQKDEEEMNKGPSNEPRDTAFYARSNVNPAVQAKETASTPKKKDGDKKTPPKKNSPSPSKGSGKGSGNSKGKAGRHKDSKKSGAGGPPEDPSSSESESSDSEESTSEDSEEEPEVPSKRKKKSRKKKTKDDRDVAFGRNISAIFWQPHWKDQG